MEEHAPENQEENHMVLCQPVRQAEGSQDGKGKREKKEASADDPVPRQRGKGRDSLHKGGGQAEEKQHCQNGGR